MNWIYLGQVGLPSEAVSIILSVDWLLDRLSTFSNSTISNHLDHFNRTLSLSLLWVNNSCLENASFELDNTFVISPAKTRFRRFLFSLLPGSARQSTFWEIQLELALSTTSARSYFSLVILYDIFSILFGPKRRGGLFGRISEVRKKWRGAVSSSNIFRNFTNPLRKASL